MKMLIKYEDGVLTIGDKDARLVNSMNVKCNADVARNIVGGLMTTMDDGEDVLTSKMDTSFKATEYEGYLKSCGYIRLGSVGLATMYAGLIIIDDMEVVILQAVVDGRCIKQVNLCNTVDGVCKTRSYIKRAVSDSLAWC